MPVSHLTDSVESMLASALNTLTGESFSHLTTSEAELLARIVSEMTGQSYSHLTTSRARLLELLLAQAASDGITFNRSTQSAEQIIAIIANNVEPDEGGGGDYEGPLDIVSGAVVAFSSARALSSATRGQAVYTIREDGGNTTQSFSSDPSTGLVDAAAVATFLNGASGFVTSLANRGTSAAAAAQATAAKQPQWQTVGGIPAMLFDGTGDYLLTAGDITLTDEWTVFAVVIPGAILAPGVSNHRPICGQTSEDYNDHGPDWTASPFVGPGGYWMTLIGEDADYSNTLDVDIATPPIAGFEETIHLVDCVISIANPDIYIDGESRGVSDTGTNGTALGAMTSPLAIGANGQDVVATATYWYGHAVELLIFPGIVSDRLAIRQNIAAFYGITLP